MIIYLVVCCFIYSKTNRAHNNFYCWQQILYQKKKNADNFTVFANLIFRGFRFSIRDLCSGCTPRRTKELERICIVNRQFKIELIK